MNASAARKRHEVVEAVLVRMVAAGHPLPTCRELGRALGVSHVTANKHLARLREEIRARLPPAQPDARPAQQPAV